ncbi:MAG: hypothetical protein JXA87_06085 [Thermoleophilia bacterium]|nr:hypothetical protein [Thermoleophilia bacterium]
MHANPPRQRHTRVSKWSIVAVVLSFLLLSLGAAAVGCGGEDAKTDTTAVTVGSSEAPETTASGAGEETADIARMGGTELATATITAWNECLVKLTTLLEGMPDPATVQPQVEALKEEYIQKFVAYGRQQQTFDEEQLRLWRIEHGINSPPAFADYQTAANAYIADASTPADFVDLLKDFSILTQYTDFALLRQQEPEEAARLGIQ